MANFREYVTASGLHVFGGRDAENNDELVWNANPRDTLLHTYAPGSPFVNAGEAPSKSDLKEAAIFCAKYSQDWRGSKRDVFVNIFIRSDMDKSSKMKAGTWSVLKQEKLKVKKADILKFEGELENETN
jgi:predicted ribosome quality control (RQC) complex YloA/Tae2 family protein